MGPLTDIQDNIEKLRSLQESLHDLCTFISTLDLTSGAKEETLIHGITELKEAFANIDLSSVEQAITDVKNAVTNIDFSVLAKEDTLIAESQSIKDKIDSIPATDLSQVAKETTLTQGISEIKNAVTNIDLSTVAKESTLTSGVNELKTAIENIDLSSVESKVEEVGNNLLGTNPEATNTKILEETLKVSDIDQLLAIQLQTIIGE